MGFSSNSREQARRSVPDYTFWNQLEAFLGYQHEQDIADLLWARFTLAASLGAARQGISL